MGGLAIGRGTVDELVGGTVGLRAESPRQFEGCWIGHGKYAFPISLFYDDVLLLWPYTSKDVATLATTSREARLFDLRLCKCHGGRYLS